MTWNRRDVLQASMAGLATAWGLSGSRSHAAPQAVVAGGRPRELKADVVIIGAGLGGVAAALAALRNHLRVVLTEPTDWIGGQLTSQAVPPDEHMHIETHGANKSYRELRERIRDYYRRNYPLTDLEKNNPNLNPGGGSVSRLCHEPRVALAVMQEMLAPWLANGQCTLLLECEPISADVTGDVINAVTVVSSRTGTHFHLQAPQFIDASELGDLLPLTKTEFVMGAESKAETKELHAAEKAEPLNQQAFTVCFAAEYRPGENHVIDRPVEYGFWSEYVPDLTPPWSGKLLNYSYSYPRTLVPKKLDFDPTLKPTKALNLFVYRQIIAAKQFKPDSLFRDVTLVNWPQNDYLLGPLVGVSKEVAAKHIARAKQLSLSLLYWLQTAAPRADGGTGYPELLLRADIMGTEDGLAKYPYIREARRIKALFTITEEHVGRENRAQVMNVAPKDAKPFEFQDSVGVGYYHLDLHPSTGGNNYIDTTSLPFQIPLKALIPQRTKNLIAACKNIGTTHLSNGCYRLHPVEWGIGEAAGCLAAYNHLRETTSHQIAETPKLFESFQNVIRSQGVETHWPA